MEHNRQVFLRWLDWHRLAYDSLAAIYTQTKLCNRAIHLHFASCNQIIGFATDAIEPGAHTDVGLRIVGVGCRAMIGDTAKPSRA